MRSARAEPGAPVVVGMGAAPSWAVVAWPLGTRAEPDRRGTPPALRSGMPRDDVENPELHDDIAPWQRGEMAVVADTDADFADDDELPDTVPETRPLGARAEGSSELERGSAGR